MAYHGVGRREVETGEVLADPETFGCRIVGLGDRLDQVMRPVDHAIGKVSPPAGDGRRDDFRIERREEGGHRIERLSRQEAHAVRIFRPQAAEMIDCVIPPILKGKKPLLPDLERSCLPALLAERWS